MVFFPPENGENGQLGQLLKTVYLNKRETVKQLQISSNPAESIRLQAELISLSEEEARIYGGLCLKAIAHEPTVVFWAAYSQIEGPVFGWVRLDSASPELVVLPVSPDREIQIAAAIARGDSFDSVVDQFFPSPQGVRDQ